MDSFGPFGVICSVYDMSVSDGAGVCSITRCGIAVEGDCAGSICRTGVSDDNGAGIIAGQFLRTSSCVAVEDGGGGRITGRRRRSAGCTGCMW